MTLTHAIIIRLYYQPEDPRAAWRLDFFEAMALPCLQRQSCPDFEIWISCHPAHQERLTALDPRIHTFQDRRRAEDKRIGLRILRGGEKPPRVDIQTRHDSDDLVSRHYVARIRKEIDRKAAGRSLVVSFQPFKLDLATGRRYRMAYRFYQARCSMFSSLYQPDKATYRYIYDYNHLHLTKACPRVVTVPEGYCDLVIHGGNTVTKVDDRDELL